MPERKNSPEGPLVAISRSLSQRVDALRFSEPVSYVYNPLSYARTPHEKYLHLYGAAPKLVVFLGMNPGPFGMAQTGVPFGDVNAVRDFLRIDGSVTRPSREHPKRPVQGFSCKRGEVSGQRLWGWVHARFGSPEDFFRAFFVANYCPLSFMEESSRNRTPDKLPAQERAPLFSACDEALQRVVECLRPRWVVGIGGFAEERARQALRGRDVTIGCVLHPSPASPLANRGWAARVEDQLRDLGIPLPD